MKARWYDNEQLRHMERILDQTYADLGIDSASDYARQARELLARLLFEYEIYQHAEPKAAHVLRAKARLHGLAKASPPPHFNRTGSYHKRTSATRSWSTK
jgi:hypothetical protein